MQIALTQHLFLDWVTAGGTAGAFLIAAAILASSARAAKKDRRQAQAVLVDAWVKSVGASTANAYTITIEVSNHSDQAIRLLSIKVNDPNAQLTMPLTKSIVPPTERGKLVELSSAGIVFAPGSGDKEDQIRALYLIDISFTDTAGRRWTRNSHGHLSETRPKRKKRSLKSDAANIWNVIWNYITG